MSEEQQKKPTGSARPGKSRRKAVSATFEPDTALAGSNINAPQGLRTVFSTQSASKIPRLEAGSSASFSPDTHVPLSPENWKVAIPRLHPYSPPHPAKTTPIIRVAHACEPCRSRKTRCSGEKPSCKHCMDINTECYYVEGKKDKVKMEYEMMKEKNKVYEDVLQEYGLLEIAESRVNDLVLKSESMHRDTLDTEDNSNRAGEASTESRNDWQQRQAPTETPLSTSQEIDWANIQSGFEGQMMAESFGQSIDEGDTNTTVAGPQMPDFNDPRAWPPQLPASTGA